ERHDLVASPLEQLEKVRQHDGLKSTDVQQHHVRDVASIERLRCTLARRDALLSPRQVILLQRIDGGEVALLEAAYVGRVVSIVLEVDRDLCDSIAALLEQSANRVALFGRFSLTQVGV